MYSQEVTEHFQNPSNVGTITDADGKATIGSAASGVMLNLTLSINDNIITAAKFRAFGCPTAIACGSVLTELIIDKQLSEAQKINATHISKHLGEIPESKRRYTIYAEEVLKTAIEDALSE